MLFYLFQYFSNLLSYTNAGGSSGFLNSMLQDIVFTIGGKDVPLKYYIPFVASLITEVFIIVLCFLFVWKIIKLVGGLIR